MTSHRASLLAPLVADPGGTVLLFDFDGTLSPIVERPDDARPVEGAVDVLTALAGRYRTVGAVSGRPVAFLASQLPGPVVLSGLYGLESQVDGVARARVGTEPWRPVVADAVARAQAADIEGVLVEPKGFSVTLHFRARPKAAAAVTRLAAELADATGLVARPAKMSIELHPPVESDKGLAVRELAEGARGVLYAGDDLGDLPAFAALTDLRAEGVATVSVAVETPELPPEVRAVADLVVPGPAGVVELLRTLLP
ncbi:trehalose-phosphatase [Aquihabitans sp. G128]|uniref:trehalose-phosphatase n=1 Tax=Aquihabitans sp. G128 TaxID=2849779 RepID=UPI001C2325F0|nr:trehalose-phosphatase [Aquihabitans sp. G128]QXC63519.1 trehalose-phosphatase [Aquihabitans sp. G128]